MSTSASISSSVSAAATVILSAWKSTLRLGGSTALLNARPTPASSGELPQRVGQGHAAQVEGDSLPQPRGLATSTWTGTRRGCEQKARRPLHVRGVA